MSRRSFLRTAVAGPAVGIAAAQSVTFQVQPIYLADMSLCRLHQRYLAFRIIANGV